MPANRERQHDVHVDLRRPWSTDEVLAELRQYGPQLLKALEHFQAPEIASNPLELPGLGTYPMHAAANGMAFDYFCHLHHDVLAPRGPIARTLSEPTHEQLYPVIQWMMWGLPQMQGPELDQALIAPLTIDLTGPGESTWTVSRPDPDGKLLVHEGGGGRVVVRSTAFDFVKWGTGRTTWAESCTVDGDESVVAGFLATLNII